MKQSFPVFASTDGLASLSRCSPIKKLGFVFQPHVCKLLQDTTDLYFFVSRSGMPGWRKSLVFCLQRMRDRGKARGEYDSEGGNYNLGDAHEKGLGSVLLFLLIDIAEAAGSVPKLVTFYLKIQNHNVAFPLESVILT